jgi:hypothetical protein
MTSQINYGAINTTYPVAGQDNNSQGFRDNFTAISAGLGVAKSELTALQTNSILKADLATGTTTVQNNMLGSTIYNALYSQFYGVYFDGSLLGISANANIDLTNGPIQKFKLAGDPTLTFVNWPTTTGQWAKIQIILSSDGAGVRTVSFSTERSGTIHYATDYPTLPGTSTLGFTVGGEGVASIQVTNANINTTPNSGYTTPATVSFTSPVLSGGSSPTATATYQIVSATVPAGGGGTGFVVGNQLAIDAHSDVILQVATINSGTGAITAFTIVDSGTLSRPYPGTYTLTAISGSGVGAKATVSNGIKSINLTANGDGYTTVAPTVTVSAPTSGVTATAVATLTSSTETNVKVIEAWTYDAGTNVYIKYLGEYH